MKVIMGDGNREGLSGDHIVGELLKLPHPELSFMRFLEELLANAEYQASGSRVLSPSRVQLSATPMDHSPPGSSVHGILQARILEWVAMPSSRGFSRPRDRTIVSSISSTGMWILYH